MGRNARLGVVCLMALAIGLARLIEVELDPGAPPPLVVAPPAPAARPEESPAPPSRPAPVVAPPPPVEAPPAPDDEWPRGRTYVVKPGETLGTISQKVFGTTKHWKKIQEANRSVIPDPARMRPGVRLRLPAL